MDTSAGVPVAVMLGGGVESTALVKRFLANGNDVVPIHIRCGLVWDDCEDLFIRRFLAANASSRLHPLIDFALPLHDFLGSHWAVTGKNIPRAGAASSDLEIPLRNLTLLSFAIHRLKHLPAICLAMGTTADNCYRDGSRAYFDKCEEVLTLETGRPVRILTPLIGLHKTQVIRESDRDTLALSFSCVGPVHDKHCGQCIKCGRRRAAFAAAGVDDPTDYAALDLA